MPTRSCKPPNPCKRPARTQTRLVRGQPLQFSEDLPKINYGWPKKASGPPVAATRPDGSVDASSHAYAHPVERPASPPPARFPTPPPSRGRPGRLPARRRSKADYTLAHAGRQVRIGPVAFWIVVGTLVIMASWSVATATYFAFRDDVLTRLIARQADMQFAYEDRIAEMRAQARPRHQPPVARPGAVRAEGRAFAPPARRRSNRARRRSAPSPIRRRPARPNLLRATQPAIRTQSANLRRSTTR